MRATPDLRGEIVRAAVAVEMRVHSHHRGGRQRLEAKFIGARPQDADRPIRNLHGDDRCIHGAIVRAIMAIATGSVDVMRRHIFRLDAESRGDIVTQRMHALPVRPQREMAILVGDGNPVAHRIVYEQFGKAHRIDGFAQLVDGVVFKLLK